MVRANSEMTTQGPQADKGKGIATSSASKKRAAQSKDKRATKVKLPTQAAVFNKLMGMRFEQTKFVDARLLERLAIHDDVMIIFNNMGLGKFMRMQEGANQKLTCQFLSSLQARFYDESRVEFAEYGRGYLQFSVDRKDYKVTFGELCAIFGFSEEASNDDHRFTYPIREHIRLWNTIASGSFESGISRATLIRNPAIRYAYKSLMLILYAKIDADTMFQDGLELLGSGLKPIVPTLADGRAFRGPDGVPCLATLLARTLVDYKDLTWKTKAKKAYVGLGWIVTAILRAKTQDFQLNHRDLPLIDEAYLLKARFIKKIENGYAYTFYPTLSVSAKVFLPHPSITRLDNLQNVIFDPPTQHYLGTLYDEFPEPIRGAKRYDFDAYTGPMNTTAASSAAHERINILQRKSKWQQRLIEKMAKTIRSMKRTIKDMSCKGGNEGDAPPLMMTSGEESSHRAPRRSKGKRPVRIPSPGSSNDSIDLETDSSESPSPPPSL